MVHKELNYGSMSEKEKQQLVNEVNVLRSLKHPNIVKYYDRIIDKKEHKIYIVMEYCAGGDISQLIKRAKDRKKPIPEESIWKIFMQTGQALEVCHNHRDDKGNDNKILHRDIKPANIFLD